MTSVQMVPIEKIRVINSRSRSKSKFSEIVDNISKVGLKKPITVSRREGEDGYDLVCGQGRLEAYQACQMTEIPALVVDIPLEDRLLRSLVENLTRRTRSALETAHDLVSLKERGHGPSDIAEMVGVTEAYVSQLLRLVENGEERLVAAVQRGEIPVTVAMEIAASDDAAIQKSLQDAYESGSLRGRSLAKVRRLIEARRTRGKDLTWYPSGRHRAQRGGAGSQAPSTQDLVRALQKESQKQELLLKKARHCEEQLRFVRSALRDLMKDGDFLSLLRDEKLDALPKYLSELVQK